MPTRDLLVEDDILTRRNTAIYLRRAQLEVDEAANGEEAMHLITSIDKYDVLISDLRMTGVTDGLDVIACQQRIISRYSLYSCYRVRLSSGAKTGGRPRCHLPRKARFPLRTTEQSYGFGKSQHTVTTVIHQRSQLSSTMIDALNSSGWFHRPSLGGMQQGSEALTE